MKKKESAKERVISVKMPIPLHTEFKIKCVRAQKEMADTIRELIQAYISDKIELTGNADGRIRNENITTAHAVQET